MILALKQLHPAHFNLIILVRCKNGESNDFGHMKLSPKQRAFKALLGGKTDRAPVTTFTGCGGSVNVDMQEATGIFWPDAHMDPWCTCQGPERQPPSFFLGRVFVADIQTDT